MGRAPAGGVEIGRVQPVGVHHVGQRVDDALCHELPQPGQIHGDQVVGGCACARVAQDLLAQAVDGKGALVDVGADDLLELALEVFHDHEGRIAMHQDPQAARERERGQECGRRRDRGLSGHVGATVEIVVHVGLRLSEDLARDAADAAGQLTETLQQCGARMKGKAAPRLGARALFDQTRLLQVRELAHGRGVGNAGSRRHR
jgi:hypothetical protein